MTLSDHTEATIRVDVQAVVLADEVLEFVADLPDADPVSSFLTSELRAATEALRVGTTAAIAGEMFVAVSACRFLVEAAIRLAWLLAAGTDDGDVRRQIARLEKAELQQLLRVSELQREMTNQGPLLDDAEGVARLLEKHAEPGAPDVRTMAKEGDWEWLYYLHRYCSALIHPGVLARAGAVTEVEGLDLEAVLRWAYAAAAMASLAVARSVLSLLPSTGLPTNQMYLLGSGHAPALGQ